MITNKLFLLLFKQKIGKPEPPAGRIKVRKVTKESVLLEWNKPYSSGGVRLHGYVIEYRETESHVWNRAATVDGFTTNITISGLKESREYLFRVISVNEYGESDPLEVDFSVKPLRIAGEFLCFSIVVTFLLLCDNAVFW